MSRRLGKILCGMIGKTGSLRLPFLPFLWAVFFWSGHAVHAGIDNTVTVTGTAPGGAAISPTPTASESVDVIDAVTGLTVLKTSNVSSVSDAGDVVNYTVRVTNSGNVTASAITVTDTLISLVCPTSGNNTIVTLAPGAFEECTGSYTVLQADFDLRGTNDGSAEDNDIDNIASADGTSNGAAVSGNDSNEVTLNINPDLTIVKTFTLNEEVAVDGFAGAGETVTYSFAVTNSGNVTIDDVVVNETAFNGTNGSVVPAGELLTDDVAPALDSSDVSTDGSWDSIAPGDTVTFTGTYTINQTDVDTLQ